MKVRIEYIVAIIVVIIILFSCYVAGRDKNEGEKEYMSGKVNVLMTIKDYGEIKLELDADTAPITVSNFVELVNSKF